MKKEGLIRKAGAGRSVRWGWVPIAIDYLLYEGGKILKYELPNCHPAKYQNSQDNILHWCLLVLTKIIIIPLILLCILDY